MHLTENVKIYESDGIGGKVAATKQNWEKDEQTNESLYYW